MADSTMVDALLYCWKKNGDYGAKLVADLSAEQMLAMPAPGANHPAWVFSHLSAYYPVLEAILEGRPFEDPKNHTFGMLSKPEADASVYASKDELVDGWRAGHESVAAAMKAADDAVFEAPQTLERWQPIMPKLGISLHYLMIAHENIHLGQLSAWRRLQNMPAV